MSNMIWQLFGIIAFALNAFVLIENLKESKRLLVFLGFLGVGFSIAIIINGAN